MCLHQITCTGHALIFTTTRRHMLIFGRMYQTVGIQAVSLIDS